MFNQLPLIKKELCNVPVSGSICQADVLKTLQWLHRAGDTFEIRTMYSSINQYMSIGCGYFQNIETAVDALIQHVEEYDPQQIYVTLNPVNSAIYSRVKDRIAVRQKVTVKDDDIIRLRNILVDCDPVRPAGIPSNDSELEAAQRKAYEIKTWLLGKEFSAPLMGISGNGFHLIIPVDLEANEENKKLVKDFIEAISIKFSDDQIKVDSAVHNPSRISKLYGTFPRKGDGHGDRQNRMSMIIEYPERIEVLRDLLEVVVKEIGVVVPAQKTSKRKKTVNSKDNRMMNVERFLENRGIGYTYKGNGKYILDECVFNSDHCNGEVAILQDENGKTAYHCFHDSCHGLYWQDFVEKVGKATSNDFDETWEEPMFDDDHDEPVPTCPQVKLFPLEFLPEGLRKFIADVSQKTKSPLSIVGITTLCTLAAAVQNVAVIKKAGWDTLQNMSLYSLCIAESAGGKSRGMSPIIRPYREWQADKQNEVNNKTRLNRSFVKSLQRQLDELLKQNGNIIEVHKLEEQIEENSNPLGGNCLVNDHTMEAALVQMQRTDDRAASLEGESRFLEQVLGLTYQTNGHSSQVTNCWDGETISVGRINRKPVVLHRPAMTLCLGVQPSVFQKFYKDTKFSDTGVLQRFLFVQPDNIFAIAEEGDEIDPALMESWKQKVLVLASMPVKRASGSGSERYRKITPDIIKIHPEGEKLLRQVDEWVVATLRERLETLNVRYRNWLGRLVGQIVRIAGLLHAYRYETDFINHNISVDDVTCAVQLGWFFKYEAERILNGAVVNETACHAEIIKKHIQQKQIKAFTTREIRNRLRRRIQQDENMTQTEKLKKALEELEGQGFLRREPRGRQEVWSVVND